MYDVYVDKNDLRNGNVLFETHCDPFVNFWFLWLYSVGFGDVYFLICVQARLLEKQAPFQDVEHVYV